MKMRTKRRDYLRHRRCKKNGLKSEGSIRCEDCNIMTPGIITTEIPVIVYLVTMISLIFIGKWTFLIAPVVFLVLKNQIRRCPECQMIIETKILFSVKSTHDAVKRIGLTVSYSILH